MRVFLRSENEVKISVLKLSEDNNETLNYNTSKSGKQLFSAAERLT